MADLKVKLNNVRAFFPKYFKGQEEPFANKGDAYYSGSFGFARDHADLPQLREAIVAAAKAKWPTQWESMLLEFKAKDKLPVHDGDVKASKPYGAAYAGKLYLSARNNAKTNPAVPVFDTVIDPATGQAREIKDLNDKFAPYSGCMVNVYVNLFGYSKDGGMGIGASIAGVQVIRNAEGTGLVGERLAGGVQSTAADYEAIPAKADDKTAVASTGSAANLF